MNFRSAVVAGVAFGVIGVGSAFATFARVESMGKNTTYIMDDVSIFDNPANINFYPNYLIGEFGNYTDDVPAGTNLDPKTPTFGGIFAVPLGASSSPDARISIGGLFGRLDTELTKYLPTRFVGDNVRDTTVLPNTVTNFDGFLGGTFSNGNAIGLHIYIAHQDGGYETPSGVYQVDKDAYASVVRADGGINWQFRNSIDFEASFGLARIQYGPEHKGFFDDGDFSYLGKARAFFTLEAIDGELVPAASGSFIQSPGIRNIHAQAGLGINVALDRGFFWLGADFVWNQLKAHDWEFDYTTKESTYNSQYSDELMWDKRQDVGGQISFGIERNIWYDWFVIRVGGKKSILYTSCDQDPRNVGKSGVCLENGNFFSTNPLADGSSDDHVGFGFGINIEEKLKIDVTVAEDLLYRNPFQGEGRFFSRISASYSF
ncbi:MAG TPA: hypothetical protein PK366_01005 [Fibrobacteraceae bacterium]|nr:hypothetical protein [Fibrobacteraceae bacterium]